MGDQGPLRVEIDGSAKLPIVRVSGEMDLATAPLLEEAISLSGLYGGPFAISLADVTFVDSSGLHALINIAQHRNGLGPLTLLDVPERAQRVMGVVGLTEVAPIELRKESDL